METTGKKKHKSGFALLKEKYAKLEKERDEWKAKCDKWKSTADTHLVNYDKERYMKYGLEEKVAFLLKHCPFWVRWMYLKQFEKGGN